VRVLVERFERFSYTISEIYRYWHKIAADEMETYGLKGPYSVYLIALHRHNEGLTAVQLSELCSRDKSDVSRALASLEKKGLVVRKRVGHNLYRACVQLTESGKTVAEYLCKRADLAVKIGGNGLSEEHRAILYHSLELIAENLQKASKEGLSPPSES
jgi:DNA-binding MarR family transcriptional regulator